MASNFICATQNFLPHIISGLKKLFKGKCHRTTYLGCAQEQFSNYTQSYQMRIQDVCLNCKAELNRNHLDINLFFRNLQMAILIGKYQPKIFDKDLMRQNATKLMKLFKVYHSLCENADKKQVPKKKQTKREEPVVLEISDQSDYSIGQVKKEQASQEEGENDDDDDSVCKNAEKKEIPKKREAKRQETVRRKQSKESQDSIGEAKKEQASEEKEENHNDSVCKSAGQKQVPKKFESKESDD